MWPATDDEVAELEARATAMLADEGTGSVPAPRGAESPSAAAAATDGPAVDPHLRTAEAS
jgi:hypothetical protein